MVGTMQVAVELDGEQDENGALVGQVDRLIQVVGDVSEVVVEVREAFETTAGLLTELLDVTSGMRIVLVPKVA